jgi:hypothetical protein
LTASGFDISNTVRNFDRKISFSQEHVNGMGKSADRYPVGASGATTLGQEKALFEPVRERVGSAPTVTTSDQRRPFSVDMYCTDRGGRHRAVVGSAAPTTRFGRPGVIAVAVVRTPGAV